MSKYLICFMVIGLLIGYTPAFAQDIDQWPAATDFDADVHFWCGDDSLYSAIPSGQGNLFSETILILTGGDQGTEDISIAGKDAKKSVANYCNVADELFFLLPDLPVIDVLVQYFANSESKRDNMGFLLGTLPGDYMNYVEGFNFESVTDQFEWRLFRVDNSGAWAGNVHDDSQGDITYGGVNGGTMRLGGTNGLIFRAIAIGPEGAFGEPEDINTANAVEFNPDEYAILAEWDAHNGVINGLDLHRVAGGDQETIESNDVGPAGDKRQAVRPAYDDGSDATQDIYVNWAILDEHFGPTSQPSSKVKIVAEYYDDPALAGTIFGPEVYVTAGDELAFYSEANRTVLEGSGGWREAVWFVSDVKLKGVNVEPQGVARFTFGGPVYVSRIRVGMIRSSGIYENVDPIPDAYPFDPDPYEIYAELNINEPELSIGLDYGTSGGDQEYLVEDDIGPAEDKRTGIRPALGEASEPFDSHINWSIINEHFGPSNQPNAVLKIAVDYYDDPMLVDQDFGPQVYQSDVYGTLQFKFVSDEDRVVITGTDEWKTAAWIVDDVNFTGVNQGPQAAIRFSFSEEGSIYISRVRYAVIRPVGINAGVDMLSDVEINTEVNLWELY